jgi:prolipoprotein diacylglyceryltransferase
MTFPVYFNLFGHRIHPHMVLELIGYSAGFQLYLRTRNRWPRAAMPTEQNMWLIVGCVFGALFGSKGLALVESIDAYRPHLADPRTWIAGKTIVGGLLGGWAGVELAKWRMHIRHSTGDAFVFPLILGIAIGRVGCFLTGLDDHTHGVHSSLPWAVNFGDGPRHPTQLYEIAFLALLGVALARFARPSAARPNGRVFRLFMLGYLAFRFVIEFIKPRETHLAGLSMIQTACLIGVGVCLWQLRRGHAAVDADIEPIVQPESDGTHAAHA